MSNDFNRTNKHRRKINKKNIRRYARGGRVACPSGWQLINGQCMPPVGVSGKGGRGHLKPPYSGGPGWDFSDIDWDFDIDVFSYWTDQIPDVTDWWSSPWSGNDHDGFSVEELCWYHCTMIVGQNTGSWVSCGGSMGLGDHPDDPEAGAWWVNCQCHDCSIIDEDILEACGYLWTDCWGGTDSGCHVYNWDAYYTPGDGHGDCGTWIGNACEGQCLTSGSEYSFMYDWEL